MSELTLIYTDGACSGNPGPGGWAAVIVTPDGRLRELAGGERPTTNNRMEMTGALAALQHVAQRPEPVRLYTDSTYVISGVTKWVHGWKRRGWLTADGKPVLNRDLWERLDDLSARRRGRLEWRYVRGHSGHDANERCDELAVAFSKGGRPPLYDGPLVGCGYSVLEPEDEPLPERSTAFKKPAGPKGGFYLSLVDGEARRHATWPECQARVQGVSGARFKKVASAEEEAAVLRAWNQSAR